MPPKKKVQKVSLNEFLGDTALGSWADEMESLPNAPAVRADDDSGRDRYGSRRGDDFLSSRPDRGPALAREEVPLPTNPPFTAFVGNLAFDLTELELEEFFSPLATKSVKVIRDRDDKPKGFGYVEFADLDGLKDALSRNGTSFSNRAVRISVAEPPKERERSGFGGGYEDDSKFDNPWRRDKPLQNDFSGSRDGPRRRFEPGQERERLPSVSEGVSDWRSMARPARPPPSSHEGMPPPDGPPPFKRRGSGFAEGSAGLADSEDKWSIGSKFKPSSDDSGSGSRFGSMRGRATEEPKEDEGDWRSSSRPRPGPARGSTSPNSSTPPTPQLGSRRKLELLPRSNANSVAPSPVSSPRFSPAAAAAPASKSNPFGSAKPIDSLTREKEIEDKIKTQGEKHSMSRTSSRTGIERTTSRPGIERTSSRPGAERSGWRDAARPRAASPATSERKEEGGEEKEKSPVTIAKRVSTAPSVRPTLSFANALAKKEEEEAASKEAEKK